MPTANVTLRDVFRAADINAVVWIDDKFDEPPSDLDSVALREAVAIVLARNIVPTHSVFNGLTTDMPPEQWAAAVQDLAASDLIEARRAFDELRQLASDADAVSEYNENEIEAILASFGDVTITRLGRDKWLTEKDTVKAAVSPETLVLVDREFKVEGVVSNLGDEILREFATLPVVANLVMLTHSVSREQAAAATDSLAQELQIDRVRFAVMSKERTQGGPKDTEEQLRRSFRVVFTQRACIELAGAIASAIRDDVQGTLSLLSSESVFELDRAVFQNSLTEGASEIDVIARIFFLRQRVRAQTLFSESEMCRRELRRIRQLRALEELPPMADRKPSTRLVEWRRDEVFDPPERINATRSPIANGDIFRCGDSGPVYVLLAQPCDLVVRANGHRTADEGFFVRARPSKDSDAQKGTSRQHPDMNPRFYKLPAFIDESEWRLDFCSWVSVALSCLDLAVFNDGGELTASANMQASELLLPGWQVKSADVAARLQNAAKGIPTEFKTMTVGKLGKAQPTFTDGVLSFAYKRIGRLRAPWAVAAYAALSAYHTRAAFDHNFAEGLLSRPARQDEEE